MHSMIHVEFNDISELFRSQDIYGHYRATHGRLITIIFDEKKK